MIVATHGLFDSALDRHFAGVTTILHAGDIGGADVVRRLQQIVPVVAVSGSIDDFERSGFPRVQVIRRAGMPIAVRHILFEKGRLTDEVREWLDTVKPDICVLDHSHRPTINQCGSTLLFNPGSAGPKRFSLPRGIGVLSLADGHVKTQIIELESGPPLRRRVRPLSI